MYNVYTCREKERKRETRQTERNGVLNVVLLWISIILICLCNVMIRICFWDMKLFQTTLINYGAYKLTNYFCYYYWLLLIMLIIYNRYLFNLYLYCSMTLVLLIFMNSFASSALFWWSLQMHIWYSNLGMICSC